MKKNEHRHPELSLLDDEARRLIRDKSRRSFLVGGLAAVAGIGGYEWITRAPAEDEVPWPQRRVLDLNGRLSEEYLNDKHLMATYPPDKIGGVKPNGDIGIEQPLEAGKWTLQVTAPGRQPILLSLDDLKQLPKTEMTTRFCCIEGWSGVAHWGGARFSDFSKNLFGPGYRIPPYVYMATPDGEYYVGLDMKSALHPQTLLAYEQNGRPLEERRGAPLRLAIPVKYGIKNIKRIGLIQYTDKRPADYWADEGYDWFAGL
ncbi:MAG: molybdopterin-dependent oxidoreductase [Bryobacteraceae bacterium]